MIKFLPVVLAGLLVVALALLVRAIAWAFMGEEETLVDDAEMRALQIEKDRAVENLRDLEFDLQLKKISEEDYDAMKGPAQIRALDAIRALDEASRKMVVGVALLLCSVMAFPQTAIAMPGMGGAAEKSGLRQMTQVHVSMLQEKRGARPSTRCECSPGSPCEENRSEKIA